MKEREQIIIGRSSRFGLMSLSKDIINLHIMLLGKSGSGKSTGMMSLIMQFFQKGHIVIAINWRRCLDEGSIMPELQNAYTSNRKRIDVVREKLQIPLFTPVVDEQGHVEDKASVVQRIVNLMAKTCKITESQKICVKSAVSNTYENGTYKENGISEIQSFLEAQEYKTALNAAGRLSSLCAQNCFIDGDFLEETKDKIIELDLNGLQYDDQTKVVYFVLDHILRMANAGKFIHKPITLVIDECQNLDFSPGSTMATLLNESRKLGVNLIMATPRMLSGSNNMQVAQQCGTILHYKPISEDRRKIAKQIDPKNIDGQVFNLANLKRGQFVASSEFDNSICKLPDALTLETYLPEESVSDTEKEHLD